VAKVFFIKNPDQVDQLFDASNIAGKIEKGDYTALKIHFGERGNTAYIKANRAKAIVKKVRQAGGKPFWIEANTLYKGSRSDTLSHLQTAFDHGYTFGKTGAHVLIADGLEGKAYTKIKVDYKHFKDLYVAPLTFEADTIIAVSHFKGHELTGFGGALKNIGMGLASRAGKQQMHADIKPKVDKEICTACGRCIDWCPENAISMSPEGVAKIDEKLCIGCGECVVTCRFDAISVSWAGTPDVVQEKIAEYTAGILSKFNNKYAFINYITNVSPNCDCYDHNGPPIVPDIGIVASFDPVAADQASIDLVNKASGKDTFKELWPKVDYEVQLKHAEKIGLGSRKYELITIT
jgi:uncharacterized protein